MKRLLSIYIGSLFLFTSCSRDLDPMLGPVTLEFDNRLEDHPGFTITYDIVDIKLRRDDGLIQHDGQTHHVDASNEASQEITLNDLSSGGYEEVTFIVQSINVQGSFTYQSVKDTVTLSMPRTPVRSGHQPQVHIIFDVNKVSTGVRSAFVVDHIHEN